MAAVADDSLPRFGLSEVARRGGDLPAAFEHSRQGLLRSDVNPGQLTMFGNLAAATERWEMAAWAFDRALRIEPDLQPAREGLEAVKALAAGRAPARP